MRTQCLFPTCTYDAYVNGRCYAHDKVSSGLLVIDDWRPDRTTGKVNFRQPLAFRGIPDPRRHVMASGVVDDEQRELADLLEVMGAPAEEIKGAVTRRKHRTRALNKHRRLL